MQREEYKELLSSHKGSKRLKNESHVEYEFRRKKEKLQTKRYLKGFPINKEEKK